MRVFIYLFIIIIRPHLSTYYGLLLQTEYHGLSVCLYVCLSVTIVSPAEMAEPIEMPFRLG